MTWFRTQLAAVGIVLLALVGAASVLTFAHPTYSARVTSKTIDMSSESHYTSGQVTKAFAEHGIRLIRRKGDHGTIFFADMSLDRKDDGFLVTIFNPQAKVMFGTGYSAPKPLYEKRVGNVMVGYGGHNATFAARVAAATEAIAP
jgi:hypothetical protein